MKLPIDFQIPNTEQFAKGTAVNTLFRFGMRTAKPLKVSSEEFVEGEDNRDLTPKELEGKPWLTSLFIGFIGLPYLSFGFFFNECIITITQTKNIVTTPLQGRSGTIKEYISDGDYEISIEAGITNEEGDMEYPEDKITALHRILSLPIALPVYSDFFKIFGIESIVIKSYNLVQETHSNRQSIQITAISDTPYEIMLKEEDNDKTCK